MFSGAAMVPSTGILIQPCLIQQMKIRNKKGTLKLDNSRVLSTDLPLLSLHHLCHHDSHYGTENCAIITGAVDTGYIVQILCVIFSLSVNAFVQKGKLCFVLQLFDFFLFFCTSAFFRKDKGFILLIHEARDCMTCK